MLKKKLKKLKLNHLSNKNFLADEVAISASIIAKDKKIRNIVHKFQKNVLIIHLKNFLDQYLMEEI